MRASTERLTPTDLAAVVAVAAAVRLLYWVAVTPGWVPWSDAQHYWELARALGDGDGFSLQFPQMEAHPTAFRPPLYPAVLAPAALVAGEGALWPFRLTNLVLGCVVVVLAAVVGARIAGRTAAIAVGLAVAVSPQLVANDTVTLSEPLALALLLAVVLAVADERWLLAGAVAGALVLTRPNAFLVVLLVGAAALSKAGWRRGLAAVAVAGALVVPWVVRNAVQVGVARVVTSDAFTLASIYAPIAQREDRFVDPVLDELYDDDAELRLSQFDEAAWSDELVERTVEGLRDDPSFVAHVAGRNVRLLLEVDPGDNEHAEQLDGRDIGFRRRTLPTFYVSLVAGVAGLVVFRRRPEVRLLAVLAAQFVALSLVTVSPPRLRAPVDLALWIGVGLLAAWAIRARGGSRTHDLPLTR